MLCLLSPIKIKTCHFINYNDMAWIVAVFLNHDNLLCIRCQQYWLVSSRDVDTKALASTLHLFTSWLQEDHYLRGHLVLANHSLPENSSNIWFIGKPDIIIIFLLLLVIYFTIIDQFSNLLAQLFINVYDRHILFWLNSCSLNYVRFSVV